MPSRNDTQALSARKILVGIGGTIVLGAVGSGLWEMLFRPGLGTIGNIVTSLTGKSESFVYTTAALDPTPLPDLLLLLMIVQLPAIMAYLFIERGFIRGSIKRRIETKIEKIEQEHADSPDLDDIRKNFILKRIRVLSAIGAVYCLLFFFLFFFAYSIENKAVVIWRAFHQNIEILSPHLSDLEEKKLRASFRSMKSHQDYLALQSVANKVASANSIELDWRNQR